MLVRSWAYHIGRATEATRLDHQPLGWKRLQAADVTWRSWGNQGKQNFCCEKHGIACKAALTTPAFNCNEDYHSWFLTCIASMGLVVFLGLVNLAPDITPHQWPKQDQTPSQTPKETKDSSFFCRQMTKLSTITNLRRAVDGTFAHMQTVFGIHDSSECIMVRGIIPTISITA